MNQLDLIQRAIDLRKTICFEYAVENKIKGIRYGNPHCLFLHATTNNLMLDLFQISGVSDSNDKLPGWRPFKPLYMVNIIILEEAECFTIDKDYKPNSPKYQKAISKV